MQLGANLAEGGKGRSSDHSLRTEIRSSMYFREATSDPNSDEIGLGILCLLAQKSCMENFSNSL